MLTIPLISLRKALLSQYLPLAILVSVSWVTNAQVTATGGCDNYSPASSSTVTCSPSGSNPSSLGVTTPNDTSVNNVTVQVQSGVALVVNGPTISLGSGSLVENSGALYTVNAGTGAFAAQGYGIAAGAANRSKAGGNQVSNQAGAFISTIGEQSHGIYIDASQAGAAANTITNAGTIQTTGRSANGIFLLSGSLSASESIVNSGSIITPRDQYVNPGGHSIYVQNANNVVVISNTGQIENNASGGYGIYVQGAANITNSGSIERVNSYAILVDDNGNRNGSTVTFSSGSHTTGVISLSQTLVTDRLVFDLTAGSDPLTLADSVRGVDFIDVTGGGSAVLGFLSLGGGITVDFGSDLSQSRELLVTNALTGSGGLTQKGHGTLTLSGANTYSGNTTIDAGTLKSGYAQALGTGSVLIGASGTLDLNGFDQTVTSLTGSGTLGLGSATLTVGDATNMTFSGAITGTGGLVKQGTGALTLSGVNTYSGSTTINTGTLQLGNTQALGTGSLSIGASGTLDLNGFDQTMTRIEGSGVLNLGSATLTLTGNSVVDVSIAGSGRVVFSGGTSQVRSSNTYSGGTTIGGTVYIYQSDSLGSGQLQLIGDSPELSLAADNLLITNSMNLQASEVSLSLGAGVSGEISGRISGDGTLHKEGYGTLTLSGSNTYTGGTIVSNGTLIVGSSTAIRYGSMSVTNLGTLDLNNYDLTVSSLSSGQNPIDVNVQLGSATLTVGDSGEATFAGQISGSGALVKVGSGTQTLSGANLYLGGTTIIAGVLRVEADSALGSGSIDFVGDAPGLEFGAENLTLTNSLGLRSNQARLIVSADTATLTGVMSGTGSVTKEGSGALILSGANTYSGGTTLSAGTLVLANDAALGAGTLEVTGTAALLKAGTDGLTLSNQLLLSNGLGVDTDGKQMTLSGAVSGSGSLTKLGSGVLTLSGANTYSGGTTVSTGTLQLGVEQALGTGSLLIGGDGAVNLKNFDQTVSALSGSGALSLGAATLTVSNGTDTTYSGDVSGTGGLTKTGNGTLTLGGTSTYSGGTSLANGTLTVASDTALGTGTLDVAGAGVVLKAGTDGVALSNQVSLSNDLTVDTDGKLMTLNGDLSGAGKLVKQGVGTLELGGQNLSSAGVEISTGTLLLDQSNALGSGDLIMGVDTTLSAANALTIGNVIRLRGAVAFNSRSSDFVVNGTISNNSVGQLIKTGSGRLTLNGVNDYSGGTVVEAGTLVLNGSLASGVNIASGATFGGSGTVTGDVFNAGVIVPGIDAAGRSLTIVGNYAGSNGTFNSTLSGTSDAIVADQLAIRGAGGIASGNTTVIVSDPSGLLGRPTEGDGILVVDVADGATSTDTAFASPRIAAGAFEYDLVKGGETTPQSWYLRSDNRELAHRVEAFLYSAVPSQVRQYLWSINGSLDDRRGEADPIAANWEAQPISWGRLIAQRNEMEPGSYQKGAGLKVDDWGLQLGADLWRKTSDWGQWRAGPVMTIGRSSGSAYTPDGSIRTGNLSMSAYSLGLNATVASNTGAYADLLLMGTRLTGVNAASVLGTTINTTGWALNASLEGGWRLPLNQTWVLTPQAQIYTTTVNLADTSDAYALVQMPTSTTMLGRIGLKLGYDDVRASGLRTQFWARGSVYSTLSGADASTTSLLNLTGSNGTTFQSQAPETWVGLEAAVNVQASKDMTVQFLINYQTSFSDEYQGIAGQVNLRWAF